MSDPLTFANPGWLFLILLAVPLAAVKVIASNRAREGLERITSARLREQLVPHARPLGDWGRFSLQVLGLALVVVALARPQKGFTEEMTKVEGRNIIIAIDTSRSMLAEDISPNSRTSRLTQAKLAAIDLIDSLPDDRIGLIAFAGTAFMQAPMTPDHDAVTETVDQLNTFVIERGGTNLAAAIDLARERLGEIDAARNALIMFTDGDDLEGVALKAAEKANKENIVIVTIGVGSQTPSIVPDPESQQRNTFIRDQQGELVKSSMDAQSLEKIAKATNGTFINLKGGLMNKQLVSDVLSNISYSQTEDRLKRTPRERFAIPLMLGLACIAVGYIATLWGSRPNAGMAIAALLIAGAFGLPAEAGAATATDAYKAYQEGDFATAREQYSEVAGVAENEVEREQFSFGSGAAAYQDGDYDAAIEAFAGSLVSRDPSLQERAHYNIGNALFRKGEILWKDEQGGGMQKLDEVIRDWEDAADHYQSALELDAGNADAQTNKDIVDDLLEQLRELQQQRDEQEQKEEEQKEEEQKEEEQKEEEQTQEEEQQEEEDQDKSESQEEQEDQPGEEESENQESGDEQQPGDQGEEGDEEPQPGDPQEGDGTEPGEEEQATEGGEEGEGSDQAQEQPAQLDPDDEVDEETGYSKNQARENLEKLSDEQGDLGLLRRRRLQQRNIRYKDW